MAARRGKSQAKRNQGNDSLPGWAWGVIGLLLGVVLILVAPKYLKSDGDGFFRPQPNPDAQPAAVTADEEPVAPEDSNAAAKPARNADAADAKADDDKTGKDGKDGTDYDFYTLLPGKEVEMSDAELAATEAAEEQRRAAQQRRNAQTAATQPQPVQAATAVQTAPPTRTPAAASSTTATTVSLPKPVDTIAVEPARTAAPPVQVASATPPPATSVTPKPPAVAATQGNVAKPAAASDNTRYLLQAGAFQASGQAEEMKAKIAMLGLGARVESAQISGKTVYRVRMGPYGTASDLADAKRKLADGGLPGMAIKVQ
ncbi:SPOR domain-containing protein [Lysobacter sp. ESA13C]|uniref:SPOR domain-containing protein n=1 Tax=Lysobacter sp. ESA13C TaxID=2862676 RepID=UPI001CBE3A9B